MNWAGRSTADWSSGCTPTGQAVGCTATDRAVGCTASWAVCCTTGWAAACSAVCLLLNKKIYKNLINGNHGDCDGDGTW